MRTKLCWMLASVATIVMSTALLSVAQEESPSASTLQSARQLQRTQADALTLTSKFAQQEPSGTAQREADGTDLGIGTTAPTLPGMQRNNQNRVFRGNGVTTIYGSPYPGFNSALARVNNAANKQIVDLVKKMKEAESEELKLELKAEVKQLLEEQYDAYLTHHEEPLKQLEERLKKLRTEFEGRKKAKDDLVKLRLDTIWYDAMGLGWPDDRSSNRFPGAWSQPGNSSFFATPARLAPPTATDPRSDPAVPLAKPPRPNTAR